MDNVLFTDVDIWDCRVKRVPLKCQQKVCEQFQSMEGD